jgi:hypothetical protein
MEELEDRESYQEILRMLTVIYKRLDSLEKRVNGGLRSAANQTYLNELRRKADKIKEY